ncbi:CBO0543 family protein [Bacillus sp. FJAT-29814]|uniref:CBO0543 family protein n=1 Tax=Bacillus sp. FJAT-29814 TaxID=1729688 RepID=UPI000AB9A46B|nr:CBO0543 family protein [Bacillus sp. FJAT-29814]
MLFFLTVIIVLIVAFSIKRRKTRHEVFATILFALMMNFVSDLYLDLKYHLYWYFDKKEVDWAYLIVALGQVGVLYIIVNYFPNKSTTIRKLIYALSWTGILVLLELYTVKIEVLHYGKWNPWYSAAVYFVSLQILYFVLKYTQDSREVSK